MPASTATRTFACSAGVPAPTPTNPPTPRSATSDSASRAARAATSMSQPPAISRWPVAASIRTRAILRSPTPYGQIGNGDAAQTVDQTVSGNHRRPRRRIGEFRVERGRGFRPPGSETARGSEGSASGNLTVIGSTVRGDESLGQMFADDLGTSADTGGDVTIGLTGTGGLAIDSFHLLFQPAHAEPSFRRQYRTGGGIPERGQWRHQHRRRLERHDARSGALRRRRRLRQQWRQRPHRRFARRGQCRRRQRRRPDPGRRRRHHARCRKRLRANRVQRRRRDRRHRGERDRRHRAHRQFRSAAQFAFAQIGHGGALSYGQQQRLHRRSGRRRDRADRRQRQERLRADRHGGTSSNRYLDSSFSETGQSG